MTKTITTVAIAAVMLALILPATANIQATSVDVRGEVYDDTTPRHVPDALSCANVSGGGVGASCEMSWNANNFAGFWYDLKNGNMSENMTITDLSGDNRTINQKGIWYNTTKQIIQYKVAEAKGFSNVTQAYDSAGTAKQPNGGGYYFKIGWQAMPYIALNGKANKLSALILEQGTSTSEKTTLTVGQTWDIGGGWTLQASSIDAKATPRQAWLVLSKDGNVKDNAIVYQGNTYTYVEKSVCGESDVPLFVTYIDSVFAGTTSDMVQLRYTWAVDTSCTQINGGDKFGVMKVSDAGSDTLKLWNEDSSLSLSKDSTANIMGEMNFRVADSDTPRFYPMVIYTIGGGANVTPTPGGVISGTPGPTSTLTVPPKNVTPTVTTPQETTKPPVQGTTPSPTATKKTEPGFESIVAITGLLAVAYLVLRQRK